MFRSPVDTEEVYDYMEYVDEPMDFDLMQTKLDNREYNCAQDFLDDIDLIAENALKYNSDLNYETNKIICHRSRALQDFSYALVKAEMDTDFEDECKEIVARRKKLTKELEDLSGDDDEEENGGANTDCNSSVSAGRKRKKPMRKSAWSKGLTPKRPKRPREEQNGAEEDDEDEDNDGEDGGKGEVEDMEGAATADTSGGLPTRTSSRTRSGATPTAVVAAAAAVIAEPKKAASSGSSGGGSTRSSPKDVALEPSTSATRYTKNIFLFSTYLSKLSSHQLLEHGAHWGEDRSE